MRSDISDLSDRAAAQERTQDRHGYPAGFPAIRDVVVVRETGHRVDLEHDAAGVGQAAARDRW